MPKEIRNIGASVRARLLKLSKAKGQCNNWKTLIYHGPNLWEHVKAVYFNRR
jgi:hypothetical protein